MQFLDTSRLSPDEPFDILKRRPTARLEQVEATVREILTAVRERGDDAVIEFTRKLDWPDASAAGIYAHVDDTHCGASGAPLEEAAARIIAFHERELTHLQGWREAFGEGISLGQRVRPVFRAGIYVPGGKALYPSTVLMAALPAVVAGVREIVFCSPADKTGNLSPVVLEAMALVKRIALEKRCAMHVYKLGGAVAIGAMAYGTGTVPRVDVIAGPGNDYVNIAKRLVYGDVGIDMLAGPSDVAIVADSTCNPAFVAADLLAQTEHGPENRGVVFSDDEPTLRKIVSEYEGQRSRLSRQEILAQSSENLIFIKTVSLIEAVNLSNFLAPEHLELHVQEPETLLDRIENAGAILVGDAVSAPIGDYVAGPSHTLPTGGAARFSSPLSAATFIKRSSILSYSKQAAANAAASVARFALAEGFDAHAAAAAMRGSKA